MIEIKYCYPLLQKYRALVSLFLVGVMLSFFGAGLANAAQAFVAWDASTQPEVAGYMLHYGTVSGTYVAKIDVGKVTNYTVTGLLDGKTYYVAATAYDLGRVESGLSNEVSATIPPSIPVAAFATNTTSGAAPLAVSFTSTSSGNITGYSWNFGDGTTSTLANPSHTYAANGTYDVRLTASGPDGTNTMTKASYITVSTTSATAPVASFAANGTSGAAPLTVAFIGTSTGTISGYSWDFGDGSAGTSANPSHSYSTAGVYTVKLTVTGPGGFNTMTKTNFVTVSTKPAPTPNEIIVDNLDVGVQDATRTFTGTWCISTRTAFYGTASLYSCGGTTDTYRWSFSTATTGTYDVYTRWTTHVNRSTSVPITVAASNGLNTKTFNEQVNGGQWVLHGRYSFTAGVTKYVEMSAANGQASADAVRIVPVSSSTATITGLVAAYGFDEGTGTSVADRSGMGNNGIISGATWVSTGRFGKALSFNGTNSWVTVADSASLDLTTGMTLEAWIYPTETMTGWRTVMMKEQPGSEIYDLYANNDSNQPVMGVFIGGTIRPLNVGTTVAVNSWNHLAATYDGTTQRLYINGVQVASRAQTGPITTSSSPLRIGGNSVWGEYFKGYIDEVRIHNRALTTGEIQADMNKAVSP